MAHRELGPDLQNLLLKHVSFEKREDLRQIPGWKMENDKVALVFNRVEISKSGEEIEVIIRGDKDDNVRIWKFEPGNPGKIVTKWTEVGGRLLSEKTLPLTGSVDEGLNKLLTHLLDRNGTVINKLVLHMLPRGLHFKNLILAHEIRLTVSNTDLSFLSQFQLPIKSISLFGSLDKEFLQCKPISEAESIRFYYNGRQGKEHFSSLNPIRFLHFDDFHQLNFYEKLNLVKDAISKSRLPGFIISFECPNKQPIGLLAELSADKEFLYKKPPPETNDYHLFEKNGHKFFIYITQDCRKLNVEFVDSNYTGNVPPSAVPSRVKPPTVRKIQKRVLEMSERKIKGMTIKCEKGKVANVSVTGDNSLTAFFGRAPSKTFVNYMEIRGFCNKNPLENDVVFAKTVKLVSEEPYPESFFDMFATDGKVDSLIVSSRDTLRHGQKLLKNVNGAVTYLDDAPVEKEEDEMTAEPRPKKMRMSTQKTSSWKN